MKNKIKLLIVIMLIASMFFNVVNAVNNSEVKTRFNDFKEDYWAYDAIYAAVERGVVNGYPDGTFRPDQSITRAEFIKMIVLGLGAEYGQEGSQWYQAYVQAAINLGWHDEQDFNNQWNKSMPRLEMVRIAVRAISESANVDFSWYGDNEFMFEAVSRGIIRGMGGGRLAPEGLTTRAQALTVIERVQDIIAGEQLPVDQSAVDRAKEATERIDHHKALQTGQYRYLDTVEVAKPFYEKFKDNEFLSPKAYGTAEDFEKVVGIAIDLSSKVKINKDDKNEQFIVVVPEYSHTQFSFQLDYDGAHNRSPGTYYIPFESYYKPNGHLFSIVLTDEKVNTVSFYERRAYLVDGEFVVFNERYIGPSDSMVGNK